MISDTDIFSAIWTRLEDAWVNSEDDVPLSEVLDIDELLADLDRYLGSRGKPIEERDFSDKEKESYIDLFDIDTILREASEEQLALARAFIDQLCEKDNWRALHIKGYACYGGNRLYPCDWKASRDCVFRLYTLEDDPHYANTLGYIYYYGRCSEGVPEYDMAFKFFGIAAANGLYEGMYKLADMYSHGFGCKKSLRTARSLYGMVYGDSLKSFLKGDHANFADAALRMGNVYAKGIGEEKDPEAAYYYYLQADYAAGLRAGDNDFFGYRTVVMNVKKALEETRARLPDDFFREFMDYDHPFLFRELAMDNNRCLLSRIISAPGKVTLTARRISTRSVREPEQVLITIPRLNFCERTQRASCRLPESARTWFKGDESQVRYDACFCNKVESRYDFYYDNTLVAWVRSDSFRIYGEPVMAPSGPEYRIVTVQFRISGRTYDYICDLEDVQVGDTVIVKGYSGETEVTVTGVVTRRESELGIPADRYGKILRKV